MIYKTKVLLFVGFFLCFFLSGFLLSCGGKQRTTGSTGTSTGGTGTSGTSTGSTTGGETTSGSSTGNAGHPTAGNAEKPTAGNEGTPSDGTTGNGAPEDNTNKISFETQIKPLFQKHCSLCHTAQMPPVVDWTDYSATKPYVDSGSLLERIWTLKDDPAKSMPLANAFQMTDEERELIKNWIESGATP